MHMIFTFPWFGNTGCSDFDSLDNVRLNWDGRLTIMGVSIILVVMVNHNT